MDLKGDLIAFITNGDISKITLSPYFKLYLKRYVSYCNGNQIYFYSGLSYINLKTIVDVFRKASTMEDYSLSISPKIFDYIATHQKQKCQYLVLIFLSSTRY